MADVQADWVEGPAVAPQNAEQPAPSNMSLLTRAGGAYIPPAKLRLMQQQMAQNKSSEEYQRMDWELLKKHIHGRVNKVNVGNIVVVVRELLQKNVIRGM
jgi:pre-mRNA-splicing factor CWC22